MEFYCEKIYSLVFLIVFPPQIFAVEGYLNVVNTTSAMSFQFKFKEAGVNGKELGWYKKITPGDNIKVKLQRKISVPDIKDFWLKVYDKDGKFLGIFKFTKNINIKNNKVSNVKLNWSLGENIPIRYVYKSGTNDFEYKDFGKRSYSENLIIYNKTYQDVYVATYSQQSGKAERIGDVIKIEARKSRSVKQPKFTTLHSRKLFFSYLKDDISKLIKGREYNNATKVGIGAGQGNKFYIVEKDFILHGCNETNWKILAPVLDVLFKPFDQFKKWVKKKYLKGFYSNKIATVDFGPELSDAEKNFLKKRKIFIARALEKTLNKKIDYDNLPIIACAHSGGGYRAMISSAGILSGLDRIGILDAVSYLAGISGSTWCFTPFVYYQKSIEEYKDLLRKKVVKNIFKTSVNLQQISSRILVKNMFDDHLNLIDLYGGILGNKFFGQTKEYKNKNVYLSDLAEKLKEAKTPMPILTAISPPSPFIWFEYTPYYIGANVLDFYVPTWSFGREFLDAKSKNVAPEQSLGFYMGIWGSAFSMKFVSMIKGILKKLPEGLKNLIYKVMNITQFDQQRLWPAKIKNPVFGVKESGLRNLKKIELVDAGEGLSLPIPPLVRRKPNVLFFYDADGNENAYGRSLYSVKKWAESHELKFPFLSQMERELSPIVDRINDLEDFSPKDESIIDDVLEKKDIIFKWINDKEDINEDYFDRVNELLERITKIIDSIDDKQNVEKDELFRIKVQLENLIKSELKYMILDNPVQVFEGSDPSVVTIIYFALLKNSKFNSKFDPVKETSKGFCGTFNFKYTKDQFNLLSGVMESHVVDNKTRIIDAINKKCEQLAI